MTTTKKAPPLWEVLNESRIQGEWCWRPSRGNNSYEFRVDAGGSRVCEMEEAYDLENVKTVSASAQYISLAVNNFASLVEVLNEAQKELRLLNVLENGLQKTNTPTAIVIEKITETLNRIS